MILPLLIASFMTLTVVKLMEKNSIYFRELIEEGLLRRPRTDARILSDIGIGELVEKDLIAVDPETLLKDLIPVIVKSNRNLFPVIDKANNTYRGMIDWNEIKSYVFDPDLRQSIIVEEIMRQDLPAVSANDTMIDILNKLDASRAWSLPVIEEGK